MTVCPGCGKGFESPRVHWGNSDCPVPDDMYYECSHDECDERFARSVELQTHENHHPKHRDSGTICHDCGHRYDRISMHWSAADECSYPELTERQHNIIRGLLMGDGTARHQEKKHNPSIVVGCVVEEYLEHLSDIFGVLGNDVILAQTAEQSAADNRERGFRPNADADDYQNIYKFTTMSTPEMWQYRDWYETGKKVWPEDLKLTPETLTHWYVGDGNFAQDSFIRIATSNEIENTEKIENYFTEAGLPEPDTWYDNGRTSYAKWHVRSSEELFDYMEGPVVGYEYKWPEE